MWLAGVSTAPAHQQISGAKKLCMFTTLKHQQPSPASKAGYPNQFDISYLGQKIILLFSSIVAADSLFHCGLELCLCFCQLLPQTLALLGTPLQLLLQLLQTRHCLLVGLVLLMVKHTISMLKFRCRNARCSSHDSCSTLLLLTLTEILLQLNRRSCSVKMPEIMP